MPATSGAPEWASGETPAPPALVPGACWRREFPGEERQLSVLRRWLASLLPPGPARDDVVTVANELGCNAIRHTLSGQGGRFTVEVTWHGAVVRVAVADSGAATGPVEIDDPGSEHGRGLVIVRGLSVRRGACGDHRGRLVWADVRCDGTAAAAAAASPAGQEAAIRDGETALARRFAGVPAWFGRSTLAWWAVAGPQGLVSAPTARELAGLLYRLLDTSAGQAHHSSADERPASHPRRQPGAEPGCCPLEAFRHRQHRPGWQRAGAPGAYQAPGGGFGGRGLRVRAGRVAEVPRVRRVVLDAADVPCSGLSQKGAVPGERSSCTSSPTSVSPATRPPSGQPCSAPSPTTTSAAPASPPPARPSGWAKPAQAGPAFLPAVTRPLGLRSQRPQGHRSAFPRVQAPRKFRPCEAAASRGVKATQVRRSRWSGTWRAVMIPSHRRRGPRRTRSAR